MSRRHKRKTSPRTLWARWTSETYPSETTTAGRKQRALVRHRHMVFPIGRQRTVERSVLLFAGTARTIFTDTVATKCGLAIGDSGLRTTTAVCCGRQDRSSNLYHIRTRVPGLISRPLALCTQDSDWLRSLFQSLCVLKAETSYDHSSNRCCINAET